MGEGRRCHLFSQQEESTAWLGGQGKIQGGSHIRKAFVSAILFITVLPNRPLTMTSELFLVAETREPEGNQYLTSSHWHGSHNSIYQLNICIDKPFIYSGYILESLFKMKKVRYLKLLYIVTGVVSTR